MKKNILLCDDELFVLRAAEIKFKHAGFEVHCASDGEEAWSLMQNVKIDIVVTDCQMPRLDGLGLAKRIRDSKSFTDLPVIMLSAKGFELSREELNSEYGVRVLFPKPFSPRRLLATVVELTSSDSQTPSESESSLAGSSQ